MKTETTIGVQLAVICAVVDGALYLAVKNGGLLDDGGLEPALAFSQITITAVWLVFGKTTFPVRAAAFLVTGSGWLFWDFIPSFYLCFIASTVVICGISRAIGGQINHPQQIRTDPQWRGQFSLVQLLATVTMIAVSLGIGVALWQTDRNYLLFPQDFTSLLECLACALVGVIGVWAILSNGALPLRLIVLCGAPPLVAIINVPFGWGVPAWDMAVIFWLEMLLICLLAGPYRLLGYRLTFRGRKANEPGSAPVAASE